MNSMLFILRSRELPETQVLYPWHEQSHIQMAIESCKYNAGQRLLPIFSFQVPHPPTPTYNLWNRKWLGYPPNTLHISMVLFSFCDTVSSLEFRLAGLTFAVILCLSLLSTRISGVVTVCFLKVKLGCDRLCYITPTLNFLLYTNCPSLDLRTFNSTVALKHWFC